MTRFEGHSVLVTGVGQGLGYGLCEAFSRYGAQVACNAHEPRLNQDQPSKKTLKHTTTLYIITCHHVSLGICEQ